jgi:hypothetical protein
MAAGRAASAPSPLTLRTTGPKTSRYGAAAARLPLSRTSRRARR